MLTWIRELVNVPTTLAANHASLRRSIDDLAQEVRDLQATIKTHWTENLDAIPPPLTKAQIRGMHDPHGL